MRLVVDSSVVVSVCLAGGRLGPLAGNELHAPALLAAEVTSTLRELSYRDEIDVALARDAVNHLEALPIRYDEPGARAAKALQLAVDLGWAKTYDAEYIALGLALEAPVVSLDTRLRRGAGRLVSVIGPTEI